MTPRARLALQWFADHGPVGWFPCDGSAPTSAMRRKLAKDGLIEQLPAVQLQVIKFQLSAAGRAALEGDD